MGCQQSSQEANVLAPRAKRSSRCQRTTSYAHDDLTAELVQHTRVGSIQDVFDFQGVIGQGHFGCVQRATSKTSGKEWAVKIVELTNKADREALLNEISILRRLHHPHIVRVLASYEDRRGMYMAMQLCKGKELYEHVYKDRRVFTEDDVRRLVRALLRAVAFLHSNSVTHRDLKLENLLLERAEDPSSLKLCDFGLSTRFKQGETLQKSLGTIDYVAPEVLDGEYTEKCDLWSVGVIAYELLSGVSPFHAATPDETMGKIFDGILLFHDDVWRTYSPSAITFVKALVKEDVDVRLSAKQALGHKWLRDLDQLESNDAQLHASKKLLLTNMLSFSHCRKMKQTALLSVALGVSEDRLHQVLAAEVFHSIDTGKAGSLTRDEFCVAMVECGISRADASELFSRINQSRSGEINFLEFMAAVMDPREIGQNTIKEAFGLLDAERKGRLSIVGLQDVFKNSLVADEVKEMIASADLKGDGFVDFQEFQELFKPPPSAPLATVEERASSAGLSSAHSSFAGEPAELAKHRAALSSCSETSSAPSVAESADEAGAASSSGVAVESVEVAVPVGESVASESAQAQTTTPQEGDALPIATSLDDTRTPSHVTEPATPVAADADGGPAEASLAR